MPQDMGTNGIATDTARPRLRLPPPLPAGAADPSGLAQYEFLVGTLIDQETLERAAALAGRWSQPIHHVLIALGWVDRDQYSTLLARHVERITGTGGPAPRATRSLLVDATHDEPCAIAADVLRRARQGTTVRIVPPRTLAAAAIPGRAARDLAWAVGALRDEHPELSAAGPIWLRQVLMLAGIAGVLIGGATIEPEATLMALTVLIALPFLLVVALRSIALAEIATVPPAPPPAPAGRPHDRDLPVYSVLVPLYREATVVPDLVDALEHLDYPAAKLDVQLLLEADDPDTIAAVEAQEKPGFIRALIVPAGGPRTKPKALNYALAHARGAYVVIYDAEDIPDPDQLRLALDAFRDHGAGLACVQARLNIHNPGASWLTRQFTLEYSALFDAILPALARLGLPVPLGGTSNHFPREVLDATLGWDPYNVTEDADLGIRIARMRRHTAVLASTTWEEAPETFGAWLRQRTRWLKGWIQTYLVHMREPRRLLRELGLRRFLGLQALMGGLILSAVVHPWFYVMAALALAHGHLLAPSPSMAEQVMWWIACINLAVGYATAIAVGALAVVRRGRARLALHALAMPLYWLLISLAAYRALYQLAAAPHLWEKTDHRRRRRDWRRTAGLR